ncbi:MAG: helix-turn-helix transcriptional regulator [Treponema sp.]|jgi:transcriptional regulator with XRE-family HTH domain|nr:helix-turn-helix transcriptional regulator [Treponema sp.]
MNNKSRKRPKTPFGHYCKVLRSKLGLTIKDVAARMGYTQPYITQVENGTTPLTFEFLNRCIAAYTNKLNTSEKITLETRFRLCCEVISTLGKIEIDLSKTTCVHRENLDRLMTALLLNQKYPENSLDVIYWTHINTCVEVLAEDPERRQYEIDRIIPKAELGPFEDFSNQKPL